MENLMIDLETLGEIPNSAILSIGAVFFSNEKVSSRVFYMNINAESSFRAGMGATPATIGWWFKQSREARDAVASCFTKQSPSLHEVLRKFNMFVEIMQPNKDKIKVWGNGAGFDMPLLKSAYNFANIEEPWPFTGERCYRTLKSQRPDIKIPDMSSAEYSALGSPHVASYDAVVQARHAVAIIQAQSAEHFKRYVDSVDKGPGPVEVETAKRDGIDG